MWPLQATPRTNPAKDTKQGLPALREASPVLVGDVVGTRQE